MTAGGADDGSPINDFTEEPGDAPSPQMRLEAVSPRSAAMCSQRARMGMSPVRSPPSNRSAGSSSPLVFDSPSSASPTRLLQAERQYWAELTGRQVQELHEALQTKTDACLATVEKLKKEIMERLRQDVASVTNDFATLLSSLEQRLRREHQTDLQAAMEAARLDLPPRSSPKDGEGAKGRAILEPEVDGIGGLDLPTSTSKLRQLDGLLEEIGLRVDGLQIKLEEDLATALADERKTRGKAISDVCQYIEHVVALQESDAKSEKRQTDAAVAGLEDRVQVLEVAFNDCLYRTDAGSTVYNEVLSTRPPGSDAVDSMDFPPSNFQSDVPTLSPTGLLRSDNHSEAQISNTGGFSLFSEEMRESLKHIVRKVGNTMSKDSKDSKDSDLDDIDDIHQIHHPLASAASTARSVSAGNMRTSAAAASTRLTHSLAAAPPQANVGQAPAIGPCQASQATEFGGPAAVQTKMWFTPNGRQ